MQNRREWSMNDFLAKKLSAKELKGTCTNYHKNSQINKTTFHIHNARLKAAILPGETRPLPELLIVSGKMMPLQAVEWAKSAGGSDLKFDFFDMSCKSW